MLVLNGINHYTAMLAICAICAPARAWAQQDPAAKTTSFTQAQDEDTRRPSGFVTRIKPDADHPGQGLVDQAQRSPGVYVRRQSSYGQAAYLQLRGGTPRQLAVLINGVRVRVPAGLGFDLGSLSASGMTTLSIYRGPAGAIYGAGALHGAIELSATPLKLTTPGLSAEAGVAAGSFKTRALDAELNYQGADKRAARASVSWRSAAGDFEFIDDQGSTQRRINNDHSHLQAVASAREVQGDDRWEVAALVDHLDAGVAGPAEFQQALGLSRQEQTRGLVSAQWTHLNLSSGQDRALDLLVGSGLQWRAQDYANPRAFLGQGRFESQSFAASAQAHAELRAYLERHHIGRLRVELGRQQYRLETLRDAERIQTHRQNIAAGVSEEYTTDRLSILGALRAELIQDAGERAPLMPLLPALGLIYRFDGLGLKARANLARTLRPPDFDELYLQAESVRGDATLGAERAWSADVGLDLTWPAQARPVIQAQLVAFGAAGEDQIMFIPRTAYLVQATNVGQTRTLGLEAAAQWRGPRGLEASGSYTLTRARLQNDLSSPLPNQPLHQANLGLVARLDQVVGISSPLAPTLGLGGQWRSEITLDVLGRIKNPALLQLEANASITLPWQLKLELRGQNLLNARRGVDGLQRPLPGRTLWAALRFALTT